MAVEVGIAVAVGSVVGGVISAGLAGAAWRNRSVAGAVPFGWLMAAAAGWCFLGAAWVVTTDSAVAMALFLAIRAASGLIVGLWVVFALVYTGRRTWLTPAWMGAILLVPSTYAVLALTNPLHGLVVADVTLSTVDGQTFFVGQTGPVYTAQTAVSLSLIAVGYGLLGEFLLRTRNLHRKQTFVVLVAGLVTAGVHILFVFGVTPHPGLNVAPLTFAFNGFLVGIALFRYDFLSVAPLAGDLVVDELPDPVLVLDRHETIIDYNPAAATVIADGEDIEGADVDDVAPGLLEKINQGGVLTVGQRTAYFDPQTRTITDQRGTVRGRLVLLRDVTGQQRRQDRLEALQTATRHFIEANQPETVARLTVEFATRVLDQNAAGVFLCNDEGHLEPTAVSDQVEDYVDEELLYVDPEEMPDDNLWQTYETGERRIVSFEGSGVGKLKTALMVPIGDHGVVAIGSEEQTYAPEDKQYAEILARTTQVALDQVARERELRESRTAVQRRTEQIEFFNGVLRHSLRNGLLVIRGRSEHLHDHVPTDQQRHLDSITAWCEKLAATSETIRDINETVTASESERLEVIELGERLRRVAQTVSNEWPAATIGVDVNDERVLANELAEEVLLSVVENAVEHNEGVPHVTITTQKAGDWVQLRIADDGPGISDDLKATMFERTLTPNQTGGGFGLYFVSVMMGLYGGKVWFEDNDPTGTVAILEFQRTSERAETESPRADTETTNGPVAEAQSKSHDD
ncbi:ATP-binding protein [Halomicroarcula sp. S1AR25-4]|uniref:sensor histidine kinase n=1 Tax=Haloarcula sp. S1AR25-4 TaxID=2950538 RepID=UPI002874306D|nr:histidine kinase N-terminal 7TM domain-containing protein [Halomicroarcula sp. S1AR25-4]MDS0278238.1 ATP-binding protein [Halomicroarcula sp. S1AR25-4]